MKSIDLTKPVAKLLKEYPELKSILSEAGFSEITNPLALGTVGKFMTLKKGAQMKGIDFQELKQKLEAEGFALDSSREELLKSFILRLSEGEDLLTVRQDFVKEFKEVSSQEIVEAEQTLIREGMPLKTVQKLCDIHSALFHDTQVRDEGVQKILSDEGHPINIFRRENEAIQKMVEEIESSNDPFKVLPSLLPIHAHYGQKAGLLFPLMKGKYGVHGPSDVMWGVDDEIRTELGALLKGSEDRQRLQNLLERIKEMVFKEDQILFPLLLEHFSPEEWQDVYADLKEYGNGFTEIPDWKGKAEPKIKQNQASGKLTFPTGELTVDQAIGIFSHFDSEITFIDKDDIVRYFSEGEKLFPRPMMSIGQPVLHCHPPKSAPVVARLLEDFKAGRRDKFVVNKVIKGRHVVVKYIPIFEGEEYLGTLETVDDITEYTK